MDYSRVKTGSDNGDHHFKSDDENKDTIVAVGDTGTTPIRTASTSTDRTLFQIVSIPVQQALPNDSDLLALKYDSEFVSTSFPTTMSIQPMLLLNAAAPTSVIAPECPHRPPSPLRPAMSYNHSIIYHFAYLNFFREQVKQIQHAERERAVNMPTMAVTPQPSSSLLRQRHTAAVGTYSMATPHRTQRHLRPYHHRRTATQYPQCGKI